MGGNRYVTLAVVVVLVVLGVGLAQPTAAEPGSSGVAMGEQAPHSTFIGGGGSPADAGDAIPVVQTNETSTPTEHHEESGAHDSTPTSNASGGSAENGGSGSHEGSGGDQAASESGGHGSGGPLHLAFELIQIVLAVVAVVAVVLAGRVYGGEIGKALIISGVGVSLFAAQRLWHNFHELGFLGSPSALGEQAVLILASGALAFGYLSLYRTMSTRLG